MAHLVTKRTALEEFVKAEYANSMKAPEARAEIQVRPRVEVPSSRQIPAAVVVELRIQQNQ